jgi:hypothetical protein
LSYCLSTFQPLSWRSGNACSPPGWSTRLAAWLAGLAAVPALGLSEVENSRFEAQLPSSQSNSMFSILACLPSRQLWRQKGKIVATWNDNENKMCSAIDVPFIEWGMASYWLCQRNAIRRHMRPLCMIPNLAGVWSVAFCLRMMVDMENCTVPRSSSCRVLRPLTTAYKTNPTYKTHQTPLYSINHVLCPRPNNPSKPQNHLGRCGLRPRRRDRRLGDICMHCQEGLWVALWTTTDDDSNMQLGRASLERATRHPSEAKIPVCRKFLSLLRLRSLKSQHRTV